MLARFRQWWRARTRSGHLDVPSIELYLDGGLPPRQRRDVETHLATCIYCQARVDREAALVRQLRSTPIPRRRLTPQRAAEMEAAVERRLRRNQLMSNLRLSLRGVAVAGAVLTTVFLLFWWRTNQTAVEPLVTPLVELADGTVVTFAAPATDRGNYQPLIDAFHDVQEEVRVQFVPVNGQTSPGELAALADTAVLDYPAPEAAGRFLTLAPLWKGDPSFSEADFWPGTVDACRVGDRPVGVPIATHVQLMLYDRALFEASGVIRPGPEWTWGDFQEAIVALDREMADEYVPLALPGGAATLFQPSIAARLAASGTELNGAALEQSLGWYLDLARAGIVSDFAPADDRAQPAIDGRRAALWIEPLANLSYQRDRLGDDLGVLPFPADGAGLPTNPGHVRCGVISSGSAVPQAAWQWLDFLSHQSPGDNFSIAARPAVAERDATWATYDDTTAAALRTALSRAGYRLLDSATQDVIQAAQATLDDGISLTEALGDVVLAPSPTPASAEPVVVATPRPTRAVDSAVAEIEYGGLLAHTDAFYQNDSVVERFNDSRPNIEVTTYLGPKNGDWSDLSVAALSTQFDCFSTPTDELSGGVAQYVLALDPLLAADPENLRADFDPEIAAQFQVDGTQYGLPLSNTPGVIYYNATHLASLGLEPPQNDWTADQFVALITAAATEEVYGFVPLRGQESDFLWAMRGVQLFDLGQNPPLLALDSPDAAAGARWIAQLVADGVMAPVVGDGIGPGSRSNWDERVDFIQAGRAAFWTDSVTGGTSNDYVRGFFPTDVAGTPMIDFEVGVAAIPQVPGLVEPPEVKAFFISREAESPDACWEWFRFLSENPAQTRGLPARLSVASGAAWTTAVGTEMADAYRVSLTRPALPLDFRDYQAPPWPLRLWTDAALTGVQEGADAAAELSAVQAAAQRYVACLPAGGNPTSEEVLACAREAEPGFSYGE